MPDEVLEALGPDPEREALQGVLLLLVSEDKLSLEQAGEVLGLGSREAAARWYAERIPTGPDPEQRKLGKSTEPVGFKDSWRGAPRRARRFLKIKPTQSGSGFSDVSQDHDRYLSEDV